MAPTALEGILAPGLLNQSQGGELPFWHTTVVVEPGGTTTVVFCGGGGLELLMQPASNPAASVAVINAFIVLTPVLLSDRSRRPQFCVTGVQAGRSEKRMPMS
jgi:hypothetical protein